MVVTAAVTATRSRPSPDGHGVLGVILHGAFLMVTSALTHLRASCAGAIVNICGVSAYLGASRCAPHVVVAKRASPALPARSPTSLPDKITANCVVPGLIGTERDPKLPLPQHHGVNRILTGRLGSVEDRSCGMFLAGPRARSITGQTVHINGVMYLG